MGAPKSTEVHSRPSVSQVMGVTSLFLSGPLPSRDSLFFTLAYYLALSLPQSSRLQVL